LLHHICANWFSNGNVHQGVEVVFSDKDIHSSSNVVKEKVGNFHLNMCSTIQNNNCDNTLKCIMRFCTFIPIRAPKQMDT
jgi:hypothetical protein